MSTRSPRLYDVKRGFRAPMYEDAAIAVKLCYTGGVKFSNSTKNKWWKNAKVLCESLVGYKIDNTSFTVAVRYAKEKNLLTNVEFGV